MSVSPEFAGLHFTLTTTVMADLMGVVRLAHANSFLSMFSGLAVLSSLPIAGKSSVNV